MRRVTIVGILAGAVVVAVVGAQLAVSYRVSAASGSAPSHKSILGAYSSVIAQKESTVERTPVAREAVTAPPVSVPAIPPHLVIPGPGWIPPLAGAGGFGLTSAFVGTFGQTTYSVMAGHAAELPDEPVIVVFQSNAWPPVQKTATYAVPDATGVATITAFAGTSVTYVTTGEEKGQFHFTSGTFAK